MLGSPHTRARRPEQSRVGPGSGSELALNSPFGVKTLSFCTHSLILHRYSFTSSVLHSSGSTANKGSAFLLLGDHFILGDELPSFLSSKHHCEGNICLKEIVSNTRLDLQTGSDYFNPCSGFPANNSTY